MNRNQQSEVGELRELRRDAENDFVKSWMKYDCFFCYETYNVENVKKNESEREKLD